MDQWYGRCGFVPFLFHLQAEADWKQTGSRPQGGAYAPSVPYDAGVACNSHAIERMSMEKTRRGQTFTANDEPQQNLPTTLIFLFSPACRRLSWEGATMAALLVASMEKMLLMKPVRVHEGFSLQTD